MDIFKKAMSKFFYRICSHELVISSLELDNPFSRIVNRSIDLNNPLSRITIRSLDVNTQ